MATRKKPAIVRDFQIGPVYFREKKYAEKAKKEASAAGLSTTMRRSTMGWKLSETSKPAKRPAKKAAQKSSSKGWPFVF